jgi:lysophospholipase L1-like esterase
MKSNRYEIFLAGSFSVIIAAVPMTQAVLDFSQGERPQASDVFLQTPTEAHLRDFESELEDSSWVAQAVRPRARQFHFLALRVPGNKVLMGRDGWLFYKPRVDYLVQSSRDDPSHDTGPVAAVRAIVRFRDQLASRGIQLLVVPVPCKASVYPDKLTRRAQDLPLKSRTLEVIAALHAAGVETVDLFEVFQESRATGAGAASKPLYLARDTHWSPEGVRRAANVIADRIVELGWLKNGTVQYRRQAVSIERNGDIVQMMQLPGGHQFFAPEKTRCEQVVLASDSGVYQDDPNSPVLCLGDSFSRIYETDQPGSAGLLAHLADRLQKPLASLVNDGGSSTLVRQELSRRGELLHGKKFVIWEFVESDIRFGAEGWKDVPLPAEP